MTSQNRLYEELRAAESPARRRDLALELLAHSRRRQYLDECLRILQTDAVVKTLDDSCRPVLRQKCLGYYQQPQRDKAGLLREKITRLLVHIAHPDDADIYKSGVETYHFQPIDDVAQNLRAVSLAGLAAIDLPLACLYATGYLGEEHTSAFNCEPGMTAVNVLAQADQRLPIYQFLLRDGESMAQSGRGELTGKALESLGEDFPVPLYAGLMERYQALDQPTASLGIINRVISGNVKSLYDRLEGVIMDTAHVDLRRYGLVMLAASRDEELTERLMRLAGMARLADVTLFIEALEICRHPERDARLAQLRRRSAPS